MINSIQNIKNPDLREHVINVMLSNQNCNLIVIKKWYSEKVPMLFKLKDNDKKITWYFEKETEKALKFYYIEGEGYQQKGAKYTWLPKSVVVFWNKPLDTDLALTNVCLAEE